ncbi:MAG: EamA family transporter, partial [Bradyrhizobiaceae bacterium]
MDQRAPGEPIMVSPPYPSTQPPHENRAVGYALLFVAT